MTHSEKTLYKKTVYEGNIISLHTDTVELEDGSRKSREVVEHPGGAAVVAIDEDDNILLVRQYRYAAGKVMLEIPAGKLDYGEDPAVCGLRELEEETGYTSADYSPLAVIYPTPAYVSEKIYIYLAKSLKPAKQKLDEGEFLTVERIPFDKALELCMNGGITDAKTLTGILKYAVMRKHD